MAFTNNVFRGPGNPGSGGVELSIRKILLWAAVVQYMLGSGTTPFINLTTGKK